MANINEGDTFPSFTKTAWSGERIRLEDLRGMAVVLYFYPEDDTPGCTNEAKAFTEHYDQFTELNTEVIGVSVDSPESHKEFANEHNIGILLLTDDDGAMAEELGILGDNGRAKRTTFVIDRDGEVVRVFENVDVEGHVEEVLAVVREL